MTASFDELKFLITEAVEGSITPEQMAKLNLILSSSKKARQFYFEFIDIQILTEHLCSEKLFFHEQAAPAGSDAAQHDMLLQALALEEKQADTITIEPALEPRVTEPMTVYPKRTRQINKNAIVWAILSAAAMLLLVLFAQYGPQKLGYEVATISDSLNAQWANDSLVPSGTRIATSRDPLYLKSGIVQILFDNNAEVVIESPAEFQIISDDQIQLSFGRAYARVPQEAIGFTISSQKNKIIDLGTEFGVFADFSGDIELHVLQGKTLLLPENKSAGKMEVLAGSAKKISSLQTISDIPCDKRTFVRQIDSRQNKIWRGQKFLDLTDMVTGGDGANKSRGLGKIDVLTGQRTGLMFVNQSQKNPGFQACPSNPFVDGVFIPDQVDGQIVSTTGVRFDECPDTSGTAFYHISTLREIPSIDGKESYPLALSENSGSFPGILLLHPNTGITYDLTAIRDRYAGYQITAFTTGCGFPAFLYEKRAQALAGDLILSPDAISADFYVLLDGKVRSRISFRHPMQPQTVQIAITDQDRFLTLISADANNNSNFDWLVAENPMLTLEE